MPHSHAQKGTVTYVFPDSDSGKYSAEKLHFLCSVPSIERLAVNGTDISLDKLTHHHPLVSLEAFQSEAADAAPPRANAVTLQDALYTALARRRELGDFSADLGAQVPLVSVQVDFRLRGAGFFRDGFFLFLNREGSTAALFPTLLEAEAGRVDLSVTVARADGRECAAVSSLGGAARGAVHLPCFALVAGPLARADAAAAGHSLAAFFDARTVHTPEAVAAALQVVPPTLSFASRVLTKPLLAATSFLFLQSLVRPLVRGGLVILPSFLLSAAASAAPSDRALFRHALHTAVARQLFLGALRPKTRWDTGAALLLAALVEMYLTAHVFGPEEAAYVAHEEGRLACALDTMLLPPLCAPRPGAPPFEAWPAVTRAATAYAPPVRQPVLDFFAAKTRSVAASLEALFPRLSSAALLQETAREVPDALTSRGLLKKLPKSQFRHVLTGSGCYSAEAGAVHTVNGVSVALRLCGHTSPAPPLCVRVHESAALCREKTMPPTWPVKALEFPHLELKAASEMEVLNEERWVTIDPDTRLPCVHVMSFIPHHFLACGVRRDPSPNARVAFARQIAFVNSDISSRAVAAAATAPSEFVRVRCRAFLALAVLARIDETGLSRNLFRGVEASLRRRGGPASTQLLRVAFAKALGLLEGAHFGARDRSPRILSANERAMRKVFNTEEVIANAIGMSFLRCPREVLPRLFAFLDRDLVAPSPGNSVTIAVVSALCRVLLLDACADGDAEGTAVRRLFGLCVPPASPRIRYYAVATLASVVAVRPQLFAHVPTAAADVARDLPTAAAGLFAAPLAVPPDAFAATRHRIHAAQLFLAMALREVFSGLDEVAGRCARAASSILRFRPASQATPLLPDVLFPLFEAEAAATGDEPARIPCPVELSLILAAFQSEANPRIKPSKFPCLPCLVGGSCSCSLRDRTKRKQRPSEVLQALSWRPGDAATAARSFRDLFTRALAVRGLASGHTAAYIELLNAYNDLWKVRPPQHIAKQGLREMSALLDPRVSGGSAASESVQCKLLLGAGDHAEEVLSLAVPARVLANGAA